MAAEHSYLVKYSIDSVAAVEPLKKIARGGGQQIYLDHL